jgi:hypothetical protein
LLTITAITLGKFGVSFEAAAHSHRPIWTAFEPAMRSEGKQKTSSSSQ